MCFNMMSNQTPIIWAASNRHYNIVMYLINHGADFNIKNHRVDNKIL